MDDQELGRSVQRGQEQAVQIPPNAEQVKQAQERARQEMLTTMGELEAINGNIPEFITTVGDGDERMVFLNTPLVLTEPEVKAADFNADARTILGEQLKSLSPDGSVDLTYHIYLVALQDGFQGVSILSEIRQPETGINVQPKDRTWIRGKNGNLETYENIFEEYIRMRKGPQQHHRLSWPRVGYEAGESVKLDISPAERSVLELQRDFVIYKREAPEVVPMGDKPPQFNGVIQAFLDLQSPELATKIIQVGFRAHEERQKAEQEQLKGPLEKANTTLSIAQAIRGQLGPKP